MSEFRLEEMEMPAANLGPENPLAPMHALYNESTDSMVSGVDRKQPHDMRVYRAMASALPHRMIDSYDRSRSPKKFRMAVLENEHLKASFLLELGGRLWSLIDKATGRELLYVNPVFQPANLSLRNAWFSGGVEWNCGIFGHSVYTCTPYWAARVESDRGPVLRLYEFDRLRAVPYQIDCWLPEGSKFLMVRVRIINPNDFDIPMYWWSNIALPERKDMRVLAPTEWVFTHDHGDKALKKVKINRDGGADSSYPVNRASDGYYAIDYSRRPWIAELDGEGVGFVQCSTARLRGRKKFAWSQDPGGRRWQSFLSIPGHPYIECQAGLARVQSEYKTMPALTEWTHLEAYGRMQLDPKQAHDTNYVAAYEAGETWLNQAMPYALLESELLATEAMSNLPPTEIIQRGSAWGSLERRRREKTRLKPMCPPSMVFDDAAIVGDSEQWAHFLENGELPYRQPSETPGDYMTQLEWMKLMKRNLRKGKGTHWLSYLHLGVMHYHHKDNARAKAAWEKSIELEPSAWAYRNLAAVARNQKHYGESADLYVKATLMMPELWQLANEACTALLEAERPQEVLELQAKLPKSVTGRARLRIQWAKASLDMGDLETVEKILSDIELTDVREGEFSLTELWFWMHQKRISREEGCPIDQALRDRVWREFPPPERIDFRLWAAAHPPAEKEKKAKAACAK